MPAWSTEAEPQERSPLLGFEHSSGHGKSSLTCYTVKGVQHHSPDSSMNSQLESDPSCSRSPIYRRSFSAETLLSSSADKESEFGDRTSPDSPNLQCTYPQQNQPLSSKSGPFCKVRNWVTVELRLENSGSVARDHLASERTFLAYMRTSLAVAASGVGESPLFSFRAYWRPTIPFFFLRSTCLFYRFSSVMAESSSLHSSVGCFYSHRRPLGLIHWFVI